MITELPADCVSRIRDGDIDAFEKLHQAAHPLLEACASRLVAAARLKRLVGTIAAAQRVRLTTTQDVFDDTRQSPARGAIVRVVAEDGTVTPFAESGDSAGVSRAPGLRLPRGSRLSLRITREGDEYPASRQQRAREHRQRHVAGSTRAGYFIAAEYSELERRVP